jgi:hypothetical protein
MQSFWGVDDRKKDAWFKLSVTQLDWDRSNTSWPAGPYEDAFGT